MINDSTKNLPSTGVVPSATGLHLRGNDTDPLADVELSRDQMRKILGTIGLKAIGKSIPGIAKLIELAEDANAEVREEKLATLLNMYADRFTSLEDASKAINTLLHQRAGLILMQKIIQIVDNGSADVEWISLLSNVLNSITDADLSKQFEQLAYVLAQVSKLTPQALLILDHYHVWSASRISRTSTTSGQTVSGDWDTQAADYIAGQTNILDGGAKARVAHAFRDLMNAGLVRLEHDRIELTSIGEEILRHIHRP